MKTKLVYVLTCTPDDTYIEQALMAVFSARYWNPDANITLITDNLTKELLTGTRSTILEYVSELITVPFEDDGLNMTYRSRRIKTSVRNLVKGDFLFIDCDTITQKPLDSIDQFDCLIGGVPDSHLLVSDYCTSLFEHSQSRAMSLGIDLNEEKMYISSGVLYVKDNLQTRNLYSLWSKYWSDSYRSGLFADQPSLAKANKEMGHILHIIPDTYNCMMHVQPSFAEQSFILHFSSFRNPSFLYTDKALKYIREKGINNEWLKWAILNPCYSFFPFDYQVKHSSFRQRVIWIKGLACFMKGYGKHIDPDYDGLRISSKYGSIIISNIKKGDSAKGVVLWMIWKRCHLLLKHTRVKPNNCMK